MQTHLRITHLTINFCLWHQGSNRIDHHHVQRTATDQHVSNLQCLCAAVRLRNEQVIGIDPKPTGIRRVKRVFGVHKSGFTAAPLCRCYEMQRKRRLTGSFRSVNLDHPATRHPTHA